MSTQRPGYKFTATEALTGYRGRQTTSSNFRKWPWERSSETGQLWSGLFTAQLTFLGMWRASGSSVRSIFRSCQTQHTNWRTSCPKQRSVGALSCFNVSQLRGRMCTITRVKVKMALVSKKNWSTCKCTLYTDTRDVQKYPIYHPVTSLPESQNFTHFRSTANRFRARGHFEATAPNDSKIALNTYSIDLLRSSTKHS